MKQMRILVVEQNKEELEKLQAQLVGDSDRWNISFVEDGLDAIAFLNVEKFDVVVTGINMPVVDGHQLLVVVRERFPEVIRIVYSRSQDPARILKVAPLTHRFIAKPCPLSFLQRTIENTLYINIILDNETIRKVLIKTTVLPSVPKAYVQLMEQVDNPDFSIHNAISIIASDIGLTANILKHVNHLGLPEQVSDIEQAVALLGLETIQSIALSSHAFSSCDTVESKYFSQDLLFELSLLTGLFAKQIMHSEKVNKELSEEAFTAGILHQIGTLVFVTNFPEIYSDVLDRVFDADRPLSSVEHNLIGSTHSEIGAHLLALWGLPENVLNGVSLYREPISSEPANFGVPTAVSLGHHFARKFLNDEPDMQYKVPEQFDVPQDLEDRFAHYQQWQDECFTIYRSTVND